MQVSKRSVAPTDATGTISNKPRSKIPIHAIAKPPAFDGDVGRPP
jgi:hypothetical protein